MNNKFIILTHFDETEIIINVNMILSIETVTLNGIERTRVNFIDNKKSEIVNEVPSEIYEILKLKGLT